MLIHQRCRGVAKLVGGEALIAESGFFKIGFNRAARIMDQLADAGVVGEEEGTKPRKVLMSMEQLDQYIEEYL